MTPEELACWVADTTPGRLAHGSVGWRAIHNRALQVISMIEEGTLGLAANAARDELQAIADEKNRGDYDNYDGAIQTALVSVPFVIHRLKGRT